jgi:hypothetical protein
MQGPKSKISVAPHSGRRRTIEKTANDLLEIVWLFKERHMTAFLDFVILNGTRQLPDKLFHSRGRGITVIGTGDGQARHAYCPTVFQALTQRQSFGSLRVLEGVMELEETTIHGHLVG